MRVVVNQDGSIYEGCGQPRGPWSIKYHFYVILNCYQQLKSIVSHLHIKVAYNKFVDDKICEYNYFIGESMST